jgi:hypothetical protein
MIVTSLNERDAVPHIDSLHALDWLDFSLAALLTGSGPFVAVKLADRGWMASDIGLILTAGGLASLFTQVPWTNGFAAQRQEPDSTDANRRRTP